MGKSNNLADHQSHKYEAKCEKHSNIPRISNNERRHISFKYDFFATTMMMIMLNALTVVNDTVI